MLATLARRTWLVLLRAMPRSLLARLDASARRHAQARADRRRHALVARQRA
jgi:hypothetical protein